MMAGPLKDTWSPRPMRSGLTEHQIQAVDALRAEGHSPGVAAQRVGVPLTAVRRHMFAMREIAAADMSEADTDENGETSR